MFHIRWFDLQQQFGNPVLKGCKPARLSVLLGKKRISTVQVGTQMKLGWVAAFEVWVSNTTNCQDQRPALVDLLLSC